MHITDAGSRVSDNEAVIAPRQDYQQRLDVHRQIGADVSRKDAQVAWLRLVTFGVALAAMVFGMSGALSWWWLMLPAAAFLALIRWHDAIITRRERTSRVVTFYERALARLDDTWIGSGATGDRFTDPAHLYAADLDLFGPGSMFELLSLARTRGGEECLAAWLRHGATPEVVQARQAAVSELEGDLVRRENLWSAGADVATAVHPDTLVGWAEAPPLLPGWLQPVAAALTAAVIASASLAFSTGEYTPLLIVVTLAAAILYRFFERVGTVLHAAGSWSRDLDVLARILSCLEHERFNTPLLRACVSDMQASAGPASTAIRRLHRLSEMHDWQHNVIFAVIAMPLLWGVHLALAMERWRQTHGPLVRRWLAAVGQFEALSSIAAYKYEHPQDVLPVIAEGPAAYIGSGLGHPLLPSATMVRNDVRLDTQQQLLVVSGSNMSGKSTLLRTVGINAVLALMGAPVRASSLRMSPLELGATLRIQDSLQEGRSRFFAEITRLKAIADRATGHPPMLFLLDELFHGTNSHDRLVGAAGVLGALLDRGAIGLITTHDMALVEVADRLAPRAINVHFEDRFEGDEIRFDYTMKPGPVTSSNALALMRAVGLDIDTSRA
jgi:hypothetical protein